MFERIMVAVDGEAHSQKALDLAGRLAKEHGSEVVVLHIEERGFLQRGTGTIEVEPEEKARRVVEDAVTELKGSGVPNVSGQVTQALHHEFGTAILDVARQRNADLIVMGTHGRSDLQAMVVGSVAHAVLREADRPVLIAK